MDVKFAHGDGDAGREAKTLSPVVAKDAGEGAGIVRFFVEAVA